MADRYDSFDMFMVDVVDTANSLVDLNDLFDVSSRRVLDTLMAIIKAGWWLFVAFTALLFMSPIMFGISLGSFLLTPPGLIIGGILGVAAVAVLRDIYRNKELPLAIRAVGDKYKPKYNNIPGDRTSQARRARIDDL